MPESVGTTSRFASFSIIPIPRLVRPEVGTFHLDRTTSIVAGERVDNEARYLAGKLQSALGRTPDIRTGPVAGATAIALRIDESLQSLGREGYRLRVSPRSVIVTAPTPTGIFYGTQTLLQLCPPSIYGTEIVSGGVQIACVAIEDVPRFRWRGAMLDVARWYVPVDFIHKFIDYLAMHKMNSLHLHLNDDQGWRMEIRKYPRLTSVGAFRAESLAGHLTQDPATVDFDPSRDTFDGVPHGGYYSQDELRRVVAYAAERHINVVPEIDMPGHAQSAIAAYPDLGCTGRPVDVSRQWGIHPYLFNVDEATIEFLQDVLDEVVDVFPSIYVHIGGDEAVKQQWRESASCQRRMRELGLTSEEELQSYFIGRIGKHLASRGRRMIGWDEILEGGCPSATDNGGIGLPENAVVMSWRGEEGGVEAAKAGHDVVMAPYQFTYLDYYQSLDKSAEPPAFPKGYTPLSTVYAYEPVPADLGEEFAHHVLGSQGQLWTEYMSTTRQVEYMAFPRLTALAEVTWSRAADRDFKDFIDRLSTHLFRLDHLGVNYRPLGELEEREVESCCS